MNAPYTKPVELLSADIGEKHDLTDDHPDTMAKFERSNVHRVGFVISVYTELMRQVSVSCDTA